MPRPPTFRSTLAYNTGRGHMCHDREVFAQGDTFQLTLDESRCNEVEMAARRWLSPRPYTTHIDKYSETRNVSHASGGRQAGPVEVTQVRAIAE